MGATEIRCVAWLSLVLFTGCSADRIQPGFAGAEIACACCETHERTTGVVSKPRGWTEGTSERGRFVVRWRSLPDPIPVNEPFEMEVTIARAESQGDGVEALSGIELFVHAWMPDHRHGMLRRPVATEVEEGVFRVRGTLFHMRGYWQLFVDVVENGELDRVQFRLDLP